MSDLTITHAGTTVTRSADSPGSSVSTGKYKVIRVTPTCTTDTLGSSGDVIFNSAEIPNAVRGDGGTSKLVSLQIVDYTGADNDLNIFIHENNAIDIGPTDSSATANISDANFALLKLNAAIGVDAADTNILISGLNVLQANSNLYSGTVMGMQLPVMLQAASGKTSVYFSGMTRNAETYAADSLEFIFHIEY